VRQSWGEVKDRDLHRCTRLGWTSLRVEGHGKGKEDIVVCEIRNGTLGRRKDVEEKERMLGIFPGQGAIYSIGGCDVVHVRRFLKPRSTSRP